MTADPFIADIEEELGLTDQDLKQIPSEPPEILTTEQSAAFKDVVSRVNAGAEQTSLTGQAGTGKTFLAARIAEAAKEAGWSVHLCAPTHMACSSFQKAMDEETGSSVDSQALTIQSMLGLVLNRDGKGGYGLKKDKPASVTPGALVIADEASQIGRDLWPHITSATDMHDLQWLFLGDPSQLPPVNERPSPALKQEGAHLEKIVRQKEGSPIIRLATNVRSNNQMEPTSNNDGETGIFRTGREEFLEKAVEVFKDNDPSDARILAYRNRTVDEWSRKVKRELFGEDEEYQEGMWLITTSAFAPPGSFGPKLQTSELLKVTGKEETGITLHDDGFRAWEITAISERDGVKKTFKVPRDEGYYYSSLKDRKEVCKKGGEPWDYYYELEESLADVRLAYATTVHRSQGASIGTVFLDERDINSAPNKEDIQPLRYVGVSRAVSQLFVLEEHDKSPVTNEYVPKWP